MKKTEQERAFRLQLTAEQRAVVKDATGRQGKVLEFQVEELEERITPRLASNHTETVLTDE